jgi:hypothetical protein
VTGASTDGSLLYFYGLNSSSVPVIQKFTTAGATSGLYCSTFPGLGTSVHDIAWQSGGVWIARDNSDSPVIAYNTVGQCTGYVDGTTVSAASGLTMDGSGHLWVSNPDNDTIYLLDVTTGIGEESGSGIDSRALSFSENPFRSSVVVSGEGFSGAMLEIFDLTGRTVETASFQGNYAWNAANMPSGSYYVRVSDSSGEATARLVKID